MVLIIKKSCDTSSLSFGWQGRYYIQVIQSYSICAYREFEVNIYKSSTVEYMYIVLPGTNGHLNECVGNIIMQCNGETLALFIRRNSCLLCYKKSLSKNTLNRMQFFVKDRSLVTKVSQYNYVLFCSKILVIFVL